MTSVLRRGMHLLLAVVVAGMVGRLPWILADVADWEPSGGWSVVLVVLTYSIFAIVGAATYTALNEGVGALLGLLRRQSVR